MWKPQQFTPTRAPFVNPPPPLCLEEERNPHEAHRDVLPASAQPVFPPCTGASGVGRSHIKNALLTQNPDKFAYPAPCKYLWGPRTTGGSTTLT